MPDMTAPYSEEDNLRVWVIASHRAGENTQISALAESLGPGYEYKTLSHSFLASMAGLLRGTTPVGTGAGARSALRPPWPDLVISAGLRNEAVCRWIRAQSGNRTRLIFVGRTWAGPANFDLVITTPQYRVPAHPGVLQNRLTLHGITPDYLKDAAARWFPRLSQLPAPRIALFVGGNSGPYTFGPKAACRLGQRASAMARARGGSLLVTTSPRTPGVATRTLRESISVPVHFHAWTDNSDENPYPGYLALADELVVTADSVAMLGEACATGKPVFIFDPDREPSTNDFRPGALLYKTLMRAGPRRLTRDVSLVHRRLIESGRAAWLGEPAPVSPGTGSEDMARALQRVAQILGTKDGQSN